MTSEQQSVVSPTPAAVCANCGYSRAGVTDPKAPCPECGAASSDTATINDRLRLVAWSLAAGVVGWLGVTGATVYADQGNARPLWSGGWWVLLVPLGACSVGLWSIANTLGEERRSGRVVCAALVLGSVLVARAVGLDGHIDALSEQLSIGQWREWFYRSVGWLTSGAALYWGFTVSGILRIAAERVGLRRLSASIGHGGWWMVLCLVGVIVAIRASESLTHYLWVAMQNPNRSTPVSTLRRPYLYMEVTQALETLMRAAWITASIVGLVAALACVRPSAMGRSGGGRE